jgi:hypothetical protein
MVTYCLKWGQAVAYKPEVRFLMRSMDFFNLPNPFSRTMALVFTQPLTEMITSNFPVE